MQNPPRVRKANKKDRRHAGSKSAHKLEPQREHEQPTSERRESHINVDRCQLDNDQSSLPVIASIVNLQILLVLRRLDYSATILAKLQQPFSRDSEPRRLKCALSRRDQVSSEQEKT